ncbi:uncharacterized protein LOC105710662 isoform X2 [Aotus nancymaae]|uniref:uncharacterized protein LOC105710662 isoform X2 n=1 Tax=Aotus nancymaae TaxID=37293 RepID=UPI0030FE9222
MPELTNPCQNSPTHARTHQPVPELTNLCQNSPTRARTHRPMPELTNLCRNSPELRSRVPFTAPRAILMGLGTQACSHMASSAPSCHTISRSCSITSRQEHPSAGFLQWVSEAVRWCQSFLRLHVNRFKRFVCLSLRRSWAYRGCVDKDTYKGKTMSRQRQKTTYEPGKPGGSENPGVSPGTDPPPQPSQEEQTHTQSPWFQTPGLQNGWSAVG